MFRRGTTAGLALGLGAALLTTVGARPAQAAGIEVVTAVADAGVYSGAPNTNYGTSTTARVDRSGSADRPWYLRFPAVKVPPGEIVSSARLRFHTVALPRGYTAGPAVSVTDTADTWNETTLTYSTRPGTRGTVTGSATAGPVGGYTDVSLSGYTGQQVSLLVQATDGGSAHVYNREGTAGRPPVLEVTTVPAPARTDLAPASGAWLGWYLSGHADPRTKEAAYGRQTDAFRRYYSLSQGGSWPTDADLAVAKADGGRRVLFASASNRCYGSCPTSIDGKPLPRPGLVVGGGNPDFAGSYYTPQQISSGALDPLIDAQAARIKASGVRFVLDLMHEVDSTTQYLDDTTPKTEYDGMTQRDWWETTFPAAFRHWADRLKQGGATNVVFAINYAGFRSDTTAYTRTYPGDAYVDWIAWDPYDFRCDKGNAQATWTTKSPFYTRVLDAGLLGAGARTKSYGLFETGVGAPSLPDRCPSAYRVSWINGMAEAAANVPGIKAILYFNRSNTGYNLERDAAVQSAWTSEIRSPHFNQPHP